MKISSNYIWLLAILLGFAGCGKNDDTTPETDYFPSEVEFSTKDQVLTLNFEYNNANQIKRFTMLSESEMSTGEYDVKANYENNVMSSLVFTNLETEGHLTYAFEHDEFGIISHISITTNDGVSYEISSVYNGYDKTYTFDSDYASWFPLRYRLDNVGYIYNRYQEDGTSQYTIKTIDGQKGIFHALPPQLELYMFFELSYFSALIPYFFSPNAIETVTQQAPSSDIDYENYEYDENGNPVNFNYVDGSTHAEYLVQYEERPIP